MNKEEAFITTEEITDYYDLDEIDFSVITLIATMKDMTAIDELKITRKAFNEILNCVINKEKI